MDNAELRDGQAAADVILQPAASGNTHAQDGGTADIDKAPPNGGAEEGGDEKKVLTKQEKKERWKYRSQIIAGLFLPFFLDSIDVTIISTALPHIAIDFRR